MNGLFVFTPVSEVGERHLARAESDSDIRPMSDGFAIFGKEILLQAYLVCS